MLQRATSCLFPLVLDLVLLSTDAWHMVTTSDPLLDSDDEDPDEHVRLDYSERKSHRSPWGFWLTSSGKLDVLG